VISFLKRVFKNEKQLTYKKLNNQLASLRYLNLIQVKLINKWFEPKINRVITNKQINRELYGDNFNLSLIFLQDFVDRYWTILKNLKLTKSISHDSPICEIRYNDEALGKGNAYYDDNTHKIILNGVYISTMKNYITSDPLLIRKYITNPDNRLYGMIFPSSTLPHELTHALLHTNHHSAHDDFSLLLFDKEQLFTFEAGTNAIYKEVIMKGFLDLYL